MTYYVSSGTLNPIHTHSITVLYCVFANPAVGCHIPINDDDLFTFASDFIHALRCRPLEKYFWTIVTESNKNNACQ